MNIRENIASDPNVSPCKDCLQKVKKDIYGWFNYLDCDEDGLINAENIYYGMKNMKGFNHEKTTTTMVNSFVINTMEHSSAALDVIDFNFGLLVGMYERVISEKAISEIKLNGMKVARRKITEGGGGPARRRRRKL